MAPPQINRFTSTNGNGIGFKVVVPLKDRLRSFSKKSAPENTKSEFVESRSPSYSSAYTAECNRDEPEEVVLRSPTARRLSELSPQQAPFDKRRKHRIISFSRNSSRKRQTQIRSPQQSKKCMKKLPPALGGGGTSLNSPWVTPTITQVYYHPGAQGYHPSCGVTEYDRMDFLQTVSTEEQDLPPAISPAYKFVTIEMAERIEAEDANEFSSFSSTDYDICSDEYMASYQERARDKESTPVTPAMTTKRKKSQKKGTQKQQKGQNQEVDKYSMHESHSPFSFSESPSTCSWWTSLEEGIIYSQCFHMK